MELQTSFCTKCGTEEPNENFLAGSPALHKCHKEERDELQRRGYILIPVKQSPVRSSTPATMTQAPVAAVEKQMTEQDMKQFLPDREVFEQPKGRIHTGVKCEEAKSQPRYKMMADIPSELVDWTLLTCKETYIQYRPEEEEIFWEFFGKAGVTKPQGIRPLRLGSRGGKTKCGPVCAHVLIEIPTADMSVLDGLDWVTEKGTKHAFKEVSRNEKRLLKIYDLRFVLKMIHDYGLPITHYPGKPRRKDA